jgi:hypothetical protein
MNLTENTDRSRPQAVRHADYRRDWRGSNYTNPWPTRKRRMDRETRARIVFGIVGGAVMVAYLVALLYLPELRHFAAALHG